MFLSRGGVPKVRQRLVTFRSNVEDTEYSRNHKLI